MAMIVKTLIEEGKADVNVQDIDLKNTPLHFAAKRGHTETANALIEKGANPLLKNKNDKTSKNKDDETPIDLARINNHVNTAKTLEDAENRYTSDQYKNLMNATILSCSVPPDIVATIATALFVAGIVSVGILPKLQTPILD
jgi:ankyrin repeat protein